MTSVAQQVRKRLVYWVGSGVLSTKAPAAGGVLSDSTYTIIEQAVGGDAQTALFAMEEELDTHSNLDDGQVSVSLCLCVSLCLGVSVALITVRALVYLWYIDRCCSCCGAAVHHCCKSSRAVHHW